MPKNPQTLEDIGLTPEELGMEPTTPQNSEKAVFTPEEMADIDHEIDLEKEFGSSEGTAVTLGAARDLTFGLSDQVLTKTKLFTAEELREIKARNKISSLVGGIAGTAAGLLATGGTGAIAKTIGVAGKGVQTLAKAGKVVENISEKAFAKLLKEQGKNSTVKKILQRTVPKALGGSVEASVFNMGQVISEDALGTGELNGENLISAAGAGALLGGVAGGIFAATPALVPLARKGGKAVGSKISGDAVENTLDIYGVPAGARLKMKKRSPTMVNDLPEWTVNKAKLGAFKGNESLLKNVASVKEKASEKIKQTVKNIDDIGAANPGILPTNRATFSNVAKRLTDDVVDKYKDAPGFRTILSPVKALRDDFITLAEKGGQINISDLHQLRIKNDSLINFTKDPTKHTLQDKALRDVRDLLNDEIFKIADSASKLDNGKVFGNLLKDLKDANKDYSYSTTMLDFIEKKASKDSAKRGIINLTDTAFGAMALGGLGDFAGAAFGAKKLIESDFRRRVQILSSVEKRNQQVASKIDSGVKEFIKAPTTKPLQTTAIRAMVSSGLAVPHTDKPKKPKTRKEAFNNIKNTILELTADPEKLENLLARRTMQISRVAPQAAMNSMITSTQALKFLESKLPKSASQASQNIFNKREFEPSELQLAKFERYVHAVENPLSVVEDLKNGTLTNEGAEALKTVYPQMFIKLQEKVIDELSASEKPISYQKRVQLGILMDVVTDDSLKPENIAGLQQNFAKPPEIAQPTAARADSINMAEREITKANKVAQR